jgi:two-component system, chemotaxis family, chemotaxis protein CheY
MRSLIVDDDEICRKFLVKALEKHGRCELALTGIEAIEAVTKAFQSGELYDAIFLDIMMPVMDGRRALAVIRELEVRAGLLQGWGSKIVMTTALGDYENVRSAFHGQCDGYLVKPLTISRLEALLRNLKLIARPE